MNTISLSTTALVTINTPKNSYQYKKNLVAANLCVQKILFIVPYLNHAILEGMSETTSKPLTMYTTTWCGYCNRLKTGLKTLGIEWDEINIENDPESAEFVKKVNGGNQTVPTIKYADGTTATNPSIRDIKIKLGI